jgi:aminoglycoside phosphotransferase (APT) family kinase protein
MGAAARPDIQLACPRCGTTAGGDDGTRTCAACGWSARREGRLWLLPGSDAPAPRDAPALDPSLDDGRLLCDLEARPRRRVEALGSAFFSGAWVPFLPLVEGGRVLLVEGGLGGATLALAPHVADLWVTHPWLERAQLTAQRAEQAGHDHVTVCGGATGPRLPFAAGTFDGAVVHDLHALRERFFPGAPADLDAFVGDLARVLRPGGFLMVGGRLRGPLAPDRGDDVRRGAVLRALAAAGLTRRQDLIFRMDGYNQPYLVDNTRGALPLVTRFRSWASSTVRTRVAGFVAARRGDETAPSLLDGLLRQLPLREADRRRARETVHLGSWDVFRAETAGLIVRIPTSPAGADRCRRNARALRELEATPLPFETPRLAHEGTWRGVHYVAETRLGGRPARYIDASPRERARIRRLGHEMLVGVYGRTHRAIRLDAATVGDLFTGPLERVEPFVEPAVAAKVRRLRERLAARLPGTEWQVTRTHGDYKATNFLMDRRGRISGVVDWDLSQPSGLPLTDCILMEAFDRYVEDGTDFGRAVFDAGFGSLRWRDRLPEELRRYIVDEERWHATALAAVLHHFFNLQPPIAKWIPDFRVGLSETLDEACRRLLG